jgi:hypothetical protein
MPETLHSLLGLSEDDNNGAKEIIARAQLARAGLIQKPSEKNLPGQSKMVWAPREATDPAGATLIKVTLDVNGQVVRVFRGASASIAFNPETLQSIDK